MAVLAGSLCPAAANADDENRLTVAVAAFTNSSTDSSYDALGEGIADMLVTDLSVSPDLAFVERERLAEITAELKLSRTRLIDKESALKMGKLLGAELVLTGAITSIKPQMRIDARLISVETGEVMATAKAEGPSDEFFKLEAQLAEKLLVTFGASVSPLQRMKIAKTPTRNLQAMTEYSRGLAAVDRGDRKAAGEAWKRALDTDPGFEKARRKLAELDKRIRALERAGGLILAPRTAVDFWTNHRIHLERDEVSQAMTALDAALKLQPGALDLLTHALTHQRPVKNVKGVDPLVVEVLRHMLNRQGAKALRASQRLRQSRPDDALSAILRTRALAPTLNPEPTAMERSEEWKLLHWLNSEGARKALRACFANPVERTEALSRVRKRLDYYHAEPEGLQIRRKQLVSPPVTGALLHGRRPKPDELAVRSGPRTIWLEIRIAEPHVADAEATLASGGKAKLEWLMNLAGDEATLLVGKYPREEYRPGIHNLQIRFKDRKGNPAETSITLAHPSAVRHPTMHPNELTPFGERLARKYYAIGAVLEPFSDKPKSGSWLVDAVAGVWSRPVAALSVIGFPVLNGNCLPGPMAHGRGFRRRDLEKRLEEWGFERALACRETEKGKISLAGMVRHYREFGGEEPRYVTASESLARELGLHLPRLAHEPAENLLPLVNAGEYVQAVDLYLDLKMGSLLSLGNGGFSYAALLAVARRTGHRYADMRKFREHLPQGSQEAAFVADLAAFADERLDFALLWERADKLDEEGGWTHRTSAAAVAGLADPDWSSGQSRREKIALVAKHLTPTTLASRIVAALDRARTFEILPEQVRIDPDRGNAFYIDRTEVTADDYAACIETGNCTRSDFSCGRGEAKREGLNLWPGLAPGCLPITPNPYPATLLTKRHAEDYCTWRGGSLPTAEQWRNAAKGAPGVKDGADNVLDSVMCRFRLGYPWWDAHKCAAAADKVPFDGYLWLAPVGVHTAGRTPSGLENMLGNAREWVLDGDNQAAGCSFSVAPGEPERQSCGELVAEVETPGAMDVGFRCTYEKLPKEPALNQAKREGPPRLDRPKISWKRIPGGSFVMGEKQPPATVDIEASSRDVKRFAKMVGGVTQENIATLFKRLNKMGLKGELNSAHIRELFARGRWAELSQEETLELFLSALKSERPDNLQRLNLGVNISRRGSDKADPTTTERYQAVLDAMPGALKKNLVWQRLKKPDNWARKGRLSCMERTLDECADPTPVDPGGYGLMVSSIKPTEVTLDSFLMMRTEVTQEMFMQVMGYNPSAFRCPDCPVEQVSWDEADQFCRKVDARLPTETEWEYAARGKGGGERYGPIDDVAWYFATSGLRLRRAGKKEPNGYGLHDMLGGVWEWVADVYMEASSLKSYRSLDLKELEQGWCVRASSTRPAAEQNLERLPWEEEKSGTRRACFDSEEEARRALEKAVTVNPQGPGVPDKADEKEPLRVLRGGSWGSDPRVVTSIMRIGFGQTGTAPFYGFRCAR